MIHLLVAVRDAKAEAFGRVFQVATRGLAVRSFVDECKRADEGNPMAAHPADFSLYVLGRYDDNSGQVESLAVPELLMAGDTASQT